MDPTVARQARCLGLTIMTMITVVAVAAPLTTAGSSKLPLKSNLSAPIPESKEEMVTSLIVKPRRGAGAPIASALQAFDASGLSKSANVPLTVLRRMSGDAHVIKLKQPLPVSEARAIAARLMHNDPTLEYAEPDRRVYPLTTTPTDPDYPKQWNLFAPSGANQGGANLPLAWDVTKGSPSIAVAVIDNGYRQHIDFAPVLPGYDFITDPALANDGDGRDPDAQDPSDAVVAGECGVGTPAKNNHWHGTGMIGFIAASMNNALYGTGVAPGVKILPTRVIGKCGGLTSDVVDGMRWAAGLAVTGVPPNPTPAKVLNISIGAQGACGAAFQAAVTEIVNAGTVMVVAVGNEGFVNSVEAPANCTGVIPVTAHAIDGDLAWYANVAAQVALSAPGGGCGKLTLGSTCADVSSDPNGPWLYVDWNTGISSPGADSFTLGEGSSGSAAQVSGVAALMLSLQPNMTPAQVLSFLRSSARPFPAGKSCASGGSAFGLCGAGLLDARAALQTVLASPPTVTLDNPSQVVAPHITVSLSGSAVSRSGGSVSSYAWTQVTGPPVTIANSNQAHASFTAPATGTLSFQLAATDSNGLTGTATATVRVNSPPVLTPVGNQTVFAGTDLTFSVGATDADGDTPIFVSVSIPPGATLSAAGVFTWPAANPVGNYTLTYFAHDNDTNSAQGTVNIAVVTGGGGGDTTPPGSPATLTASSISSGGQVTLNWAAATDNVGVTAYQVERCQGVGCSNFALINTVGGTTGPATIAFDAVGTGPPADNVSSLTWSHTVGSGSNEYLLVCLANRDNNATPV
ncbi:MAG TPA: S8 family serine peptidase, partial [Nitrospira sp.]|nr:S8 family serine peptidase [Nitrospira sp.]